MGYMEILWGTYLGLMQGNLGVGEHAQVGKRSHENDFDKLRAGLLTAAPVGAEEFWANHRSCQAGISCFLRHLSAWNAAEV